MDFPDNVVNHKLTTILKWSIGLLGAAAIAPLVFMAVQGLIGLGICIVLGMAGYKFFPAVSLHMSNLALKAFKSAARKNPVETLQNQLISKSQRYDTELDAFNKYKGKVDTFDEKKDKLAKRFPDEAAKFIRMSSVMHKYQEDWRAELARARQALVLTKAELEKAEAVWEVVLAGREAEALSPRAKDKLYEEMATRVAVDEITTQLNTTFANLEMMSQKSANLDFSDEQQVHALTEGASESIPIITAQVIQEPVPVLRKGGK
jgi:hypothetical protein